MIIGVSGKAGVGKTTLAEIAAVEFDFTRVSFGSLLKSDLIKWMEDRNFVFNPDYFYQTAREKSITIPLPTGTISKEDLDTMTDFIVFHPTCHYASISYRALMQWYGDKTKADNPDYWLQRFMDETDFSEDIIIDDVRFTSEAALIHALGGLLVRINWPTRTGNSVHHSETNLDNFPIFDSIIDKEHGLSLDDFMVVCREHMKLFTGAFDESVPPTKVDT